VDSIEHGTFVDRTLLAAMAERAIAWTPTLCAVRMVAGGRPRLGVPPEVAADLSEGVERLPPVLHAASEAGVTVLAGTDAALPHGLVREEVAVLIEAGLPADVALAAASWEARRFLGLPGLDEGAPADLVAFDRDPREDPRAVLAAPALIVLDGRVIGPAGTIDGDRRRPG
jgi:imidazolonepropionase-like amidohydrolase